MAVTLGAITLPGDVEWVDEFGWLPTANQVEIAWSGSLIVEESKQLAGRPITLRGVFNAGDEHYGTTTRAVVKAIHALASDVLGAPLLLTLEDARTFNVRFRLQDEPAFEATPARHIAPHDDADLYAFTLRLMQV